MGRGDESMFKCVRRVSKRRCTCELLNMLYDDTDMTFDLYTEMSEFLP